MTPSDRWRRRLGLVFLVGAGLMTLLGLTVLESRLRGVTFLGYWLAGAGLALLALLTALLDLLIVNARGRAARQELARQTARKIEEAMRNGEADGEPGPGKSPHPE